MCNICRCNALSIVCSTMRGINHIRCCLMSSSRVKRIQELKTEIGATVAGARRARGLSQAEVAAHLGVEQETVSRIERGATMVPLDRLSDIAHFFGVPISSFLSTGPGHSPTEEKRLGNLFNLLSQEQQEMVRKQTIGLCELLLHGDTRPASKKAPAVEKPGRRKRSI
jgi:transcriptional regulator with XRE-family HTH domain